MKKIEKLTPEQETDLIAYRDKWLVIGRSTAPADRATAERIWREMYAALGQPPPYIWWCDGPAVGSMVRTLLKQKDSANLWANLGDNLGANLWDNLGANLRANLWDNLGGNLWANLRDNLGANLGGNLNWNFWGAHESYWSAHYWWPHQSLRAMHAPEQLQRLQWWLDLSQSTGWWQPFEGIVFACERPAEQHVDTQGRLHSTDGPAMLCRDGWPVYAFHNVRVPEYVIERPQEITVEGIDKEQNAEVRRVLIQRYGAARYIKDSGAKLVHELPDNYFVKGLQTAKLYVKERHDDTPLVMVDVLNSTPEPDGSTKRYMIRVQPGAYGGLASKDCHAAVASTWRNKDNGLFFAKPQDYRPAWES